MSCLMKNTFLGWSTAKATKSANHANGIIARLVVSTRSVFLLVRYSLLMWATLQTISCPKTKRQLDEAECSAEHFGEHRAKINLRNQCD